MTSSNEKVLIEFSNFIERAMGLYFPHKRLRELGRALETAARRLGFADPGECALWFMNRPVSKDRIELLASQLTVGETYFFREQNHFEVLAKRLLPSIMQSISSGEKRLRIWSAGCATGEEPYSIAIALNAEAPFLKDLDATILATDINSNFLKKASEW